MIEGLRKPDYGSLIICSIDALKDSEAIKQLIGL